MTDDQVDDADVRPYAVISAQQTMALHTLLQRAVEDTVLARVFGAVETLYYASAALGAVLIPPLVSGVGTRWAHHWVTRALRG